MKKIKMYDTNVLLQCPEVVQRDPEGCCIPLKVIEELDAQKKRNDELGFKARRAVRILEKSMSDGQLNVISSSPENLPPDLSFSDADNQILSAVLKISRKPDVEVTFYSNDLNMRIKSNSVGVTCHEFFREGEIATGSSDLEIEYTGVSTYVVPDSFINEFYEDQGCAFLPKNGTELFSNQFLVLTSDSDSKKTALARFTSWSDPVTPIPSYELNRNWALKPRNKEQAFAMSLLMDPDIKVVTMIGRAGGGKSLLAIAAALEQIFDQNTPYRKILVTRPIQPMGNDIGFLPGPQPLDAKIATPSGWTTMGDLKLGDQVITKRGEPSKIAGIYPKGVKPVYRITTTEGNTVECCEDHLWETKTWEQKKRGYPPKVRSTKEIMETLMTKKGKLNHYLPRNEAVQYSEVDLPIPPYVLGAMLGVKYEFLEGEQRWSNPLEEEIEKLGLLGHPAWEKFIPDVYKFSSIEDRLDLLRGLMDTDGAIKKSGEASFTTTSPLLAKDVVELVRSLGGRAVTRKRDRVGKKSEYKGRAIESRRESFEFTISLPENMNPFFLSRKAQYHRCAYIHDEKIEKIELVGEKPVQCIMIEDESHLYLTDNFIVTHNTKEDKLIPWIQPIRDNLEVLTKGNKEVVDVWFEKGKIEMEAPTFIRGRSLSNCIMIVDEVQNASLHELKTILTRVGENTKIILTGDIDQIDNGSLNKYTNGLVQVVEKFKPYKIAGHITLQKGERSEVATLSSRIL